MLLFVMPLGTGLDKSARGLAALHYEMLPAVGQVVCKRLNRLLSEVAACRATVQRVGVRQNGRSHEKWLRTQSIKHSSRRLPAFFRKPTLE